ncbi:MAG: hypothetical protein KDE14_04655 [Rhodobacteraceae bacterium]|nr:hypothetical protein [Paracoccaceae bacterium]
MSAKFSPQDIRDRKIMIGTPMYGGNCTDHYARSLSGLMILGAKYNIDIRLSFVRNESLITRARNYIADTFMRSDCTHLMFIDSDIDFDPYDVLRLAALSDADHEIICGPYPKKTIVWGKIKAAVDKGFADKNPQDLEKFVGEYAYTAMSKEPPRLDAPIEVSESGTGFMMIRRSALEKFRSEFPEFLYRPDNPEVKGTAVSKEIMLYFQALVDNKHVNIIRELERFYELNPDATKDQVMAFVRDTQTSADGRVYSKRYLSEDYMFCKWARKIGIKTWLCPWMELKHTGTFTFSGSLATLGQL